MGMTITSCVLLLCLASMVFARPVITGKEIPAIDSAHTEWTEFEHGVSSIAIPTTPSFSTYNWTSVPITLFGDATLNQADTLSFTIPTIIPTNAKEVLFHIGVLTGDDGDDGPLQNVRIFTQIGLNTYDKYLMLHAYPQNAYNTNSDNMWFPMPPNRRIFLALATATRGSVAQISAIGYR